MRPGNWVAAAKSLPQDECARCASVGVRRKAYGNIRMGPRFYPQVCAACALYVIQKRKPAAVGAAA